MSASPTDPKPAQFSSDRLVDAFGPALSAELGRMIEEHRAMLESEADLRLKKALMDKETEFRARLQTEERRVRAEASREARDEAAAELTARFKEDLARELDALRQQLQAEAAAEADRWKQERARIEAERDRWQVLAEYQRKITEASSQLEILRRFLRTGARFAGGAAVYLNKPDGLARWNTEGDAGMFPDVVSEETIDPEWYFASIVVRGKVIAAVCASGVRDPDALRLMTDSLKRAVENFGLRLRFIGAGGELESKPAVEETHPRPAEPEPAAPAAEDGEFRTDARRLARMLVSEIKLGHEKQVLEGRAQSDLYRRLQKEIDTGREVYLKKAGTGREGPDYFYEELVKILADNDPGRLGSGYPGLDAS